MRQPKMIMEARNDAGELLLGDHPQSPFLICTENQIADYYWQKSGDRNHSASMDTIANWYAARNWRWRRKTW